MTMKRNFGMSDEQWNVWLEKHGDDPDGCIACGAIAGCCDKYPNCPGNPNWKNPQEIEIADSRTAPGPVRG